MPITDKELRGISKAFSNVMREYVQKELGERLSHVADAEIVADLRNQLKAQQGQLKAQQELILDLKRQTEKQREFNEDNKRRMARIEANR